MVSQIATAFHLSPKAVSDELDDDPEQISVVCLSLIRYHEAFTAYERIKKEKVDAPSSEMDNWRGNTMMDTVISNDFEMKR